MPASIIYRMQSQTTEGVDIWAEILDNAVEADTPEVIEVEGAEENAIQLSTIDNSENKFTSIRAQQCTITVLSDEAVSLDNFAAGPDNRFTCRISYAVLGDYIFEGFLMLDDNQQVLLDGRNPVVLTGTDKLGSLKDLELADPDSEDVPQGHYTLAKLVSMCLRGTGLDLPIMVLHSLKLGGGSFVTTRAVFSEGDANLFYVDDDLMNRFYVGQEITISGTTSNDGTYTIIAFRSFFGGVFALLDSDVVNEEAFNVTITDTVADGHIYNTAYLDVRTFEIQPGEFKNRYEVLQAILGWDCNLFYWKEHWVIMRVHDRNTTDLTFALYNFDGTFDEMLAPADYSKDVEIDTEHYLSGEASMVHPERPAGKVRLDMLYEYPSELLCNSEFLRGDVIEAPDMSAASSTGEYEVDCWEMDRLFGDPVTATARIERRFEYGYEKDRYLLITPKTDGDGTPWDFLKPIDGVRVTQSDKVSLQFDYRFSADFDDGGTTYYPARVWLVTDSGEIWHFWHPTSGLVSDFYWRGPEFNTTPTTQMEQLLTDSFNSSEANETEWRNFSVDLKTIPATGTLYIAFSQPRQGIAGDNTRDVHYSNLSLTITPFINGEYTQYRGHYHAITREEEGYNRKIEGQVFVGDLPREAMKGALKFLRGDRYILTSKWNDGTNYNTFGWFQIQALWNQYRSEVSVVEFSIQGMGEVPPHLPFIYRLNYPSQQLVNRYFMMLTFNTGLKLCEISGTMAQNFNTELGYIYTDIHDFKYIS